MKLSPKQFCPIHRSLTCCGREDTTREKKHSKWETVRTGVRRLKDAHARHPDGYRYKLSKAEMEKVLLRKVREQKGLCSICGEDLSGLVSFIYFAFPRGLDHPLRRVARIDRSDGLNIRFADHGEITVRHFPLLHKTLYP